MGLPGLVPAVFKAFENFHKVSAEELKIKQNFTKLQLDISSFIRVIHKVQLHWRLLLLRFHKREFNLDFKLPVDLETQI